LAHLHVIHLQPYQLRSPQAAAKQRGQHGEGALGAHRGAEGAAEDFGALFRAQSVPGAEA
jgi:hypothetical protein